MLFSEIVRARIEVLNECNLMLSNSMRNVEVLSEKYVFLA